MPPISSQFVDVCGRRVLVRYAGTGPAVLLLHQSPQNSRALIPWIERLSARYSVFAPDTPGFGFSDPLPLAQPTIPDFAAALDRLCATLGIARALVYGVHTGAVTGLRFALDFPERVAGLVCDGYARFTTEERQKLLDGYLPPFEPQWDGGHMLWLWARFREQNLFFPWNVTTKEARLAYPAPATEKLHADIMDLLDAGDGYRVGYRAPFLYDDATAAQRLTVPAKIFYRAEDVLAAHLTRLGVLPANVDARRLDGGAAALIAETDAAFATNAAGASVCDAADTIRAAIDKADTHAQTTRRVFSTAHGPLVCQIRHGDASRALVVLGDIGMPPKSPIDAAFGALTIAVELPGHGGSRPWDANAFTVSHVVDAIVQVLKSLGVSRMSIRAEGGACAIALRLASAIKASQHAAVCERISLHNPLPLDDTECTQFLHLLPDATPHATGAHLIAAWNWARMKHLFWPWLPQTIPAVRKIDAPAPLRVHNEMLEIIRCGVGFSALWASALEVDLFRALQPILTTQTELVLSCDDEPERIRLIQRLASPLGAQTMPNQPVGIVRYGK